MNPAAIALVATIVIPPGNTAPSVERPRAVADQVHRIVDSLTPRPAAADMRTLRLQSGDGVADGAVKGALLGAIAGGAAWYGICRIMDDSADRSGDCWEAELGVASAAGAAIGGLLGMGVDAAFTTSPRVRLTVRF